MRVREAVFNLIAPYDCLICSAEGTLVCAWCWLELFELAREQCFKCHRSSSQAAVCRQCHVDVPLDHVWVVTAYRGGAKALVRRMKIDSASQAGLLIARAMHESAPSFSDVCVTSVPTSPARIRERGFDHGQLIAKEFSRLRALPYRSLLIRQGRAKQAGASKVVRAQQIKGAYQSRYDKIPADFNVLLIDDVTTTGATLTEAATVLLCAGAQKIDALVFAQTITVKGDRYVKNA